MVNSLRQWTTLTHVPGSSNHRARNWEFHLYEVIFKTGFNLMDQLYHRSHSSSPHSCAYMQGQGAAHRGAGGATTANRIYRGRTKHSGRRRCHIFLSEYRSRVCNCYAKYTYAFLFLGLPHSSSSIVRTRIAWGCQAATRTTTVSEMIYAASDFFVMTVVVPLLVALDDQRLLRDDSGGAPAGGPG